MKEEGTRMRGGGLLAMTVDVEEWYTGVADRPEDVGGYESRMDVGINRLLELMEETGSRATFFVLGHIARERPELIRRVAEAGHEMGVHDEYHIPVWGRGEREFRDSVKTALDAVEQCTGVDAKRYRAPCFSIDESTLWALDVLEDLGFEFDSSIFPVRNPRYGYPSAPRFPFRAGMGHRLIEFPISTIKAGPLNLPFSGGFYLRVLPLKVVMMGLGRLLSRGQPGICYIHPWELDPDQPDIEGGVTYWLRHRWNLGGAAGKLAGLLDAFDFTTAGDVLGNLGLLDRR